MIKNAFAYYLDLVAVGTPRGTAKLVARAYLQALRDDHADKVAAIKLDTLCRGGQI